MSRTERDRRGIKNQWQQIEPEIVDRILEVWREIIRQELGAPSPHGMSALDLAHQINVLVRQMEEKLREEGSST